MAKTPGKKEKKEKKAKTPKTDKKDKKTSTSSKGADDGPSHEDRCKAVSVISKPLAGEKMTKKLYKLVKKAAKAKVIKRGVKEVVKSVRKGGKGLCIIAGDISPIDVISHLPIMCEEADIPYIFVPSKVTLLIPKIIILIAFVKKCV